jgi:hypothetical protein
MNKERRKFIAEIAAIAGVAAIDGFGLLRNTSAFQANPQQSSAELSQNIKDYPHITDVISSKNVETYFPLVVSACADPKNNYLAVIPFLIELEVCKIWKESLFEWDAISIVGAGGLQQIMDFTAKGDLGLTIASSPELIELNTNVTEYTKLQKEISSKRQSLYTLVESGGGDLTKEAIAKINAIRSEMASLEIKKDNALKKLKFAKNAYADKIRSIKRDELGKFDGRFAPELSVPAGTKYLADLILECKEYFGGPIEMNVWRGVAAYNCGPGRTKEWNGMPYIRETVLYTRDILYNLTRMLELKYAYSTGDSNIITKTKQKMGV